MNDFSPLIFALPLIIILINFFSYLFSDKEFFPRFIRKGFELLFLVVFPFLYLSFIDAPENDCCNDTAAFSPDHRLTIYAIIFLSVLSYYYLAMHDKIGGPLLEVMANCFLLVGIVFNIVFFFHEDAGWLYLNLPIILLFLHQLARSHRQYIELYKDTLFTNKWQHTAWQVVNASAFNKIPLLFILCFPVIILLIGVLLLFGQETDSVVRAFTDTYRHGLSELDHQCNDVICGGEHYLCSVAAQGHKGIVKPVRLGERHGRTIICNRQLLVSNAFEDLLMQKYPRLHSMIRHNYNKVGKLVHRYYGVFKHKWVADTIYILMKPLEWFFLLVLYTIDKNPENRIAMQYINAEDRRS